MRLAARATLLAFFFVCLTSFSALAAAPNPDKDTEKEPEHTSPFYAFVAGGATLGNFSSYVVTSGAIVSAFDEASGGSWTASGELHYQIAEFFRLAGVVEFNEYKKTGAQNDQQWGFYAMPRFQKQKGIALLWAGFGLGIVNVIFGQSLGTGPFNGALLDSSTRGFAIRPAVGIDFEFMHGYFIGAHATFSNLWGSFGGITNGAFGYGTPLSTNFTRRWFSIGGQIGMNF